MSSFFRSYFQRKRRERADLLEERDWRRRIILASKKIQHVHLAIGEDIADVQGLKTRLDLAHPEMGRLANALDASLARFAALERKLEEHADLLASMSVAPRPASPVAEPRESKPAGDWKDTWDGLENERLASAYSTRAHELAQLRARVDARDAENRELRARLAAATIRRPRTGEAAPEKRHEEGADILGLDEDGVESSDLFAAFDSDARSRRAIEGAFAEVPTSADDFARAQRADDFERMLSLATVEHEREVEALRAELAVTRARIEELELAATTQYEASQEEAAARHELVGAAGELDLRIDAMTELVEGLVSSSDSKHGKRIAELEAQVEELEADRALLQETARSVNASNAERIERLEGELAGARAAVASAEEQLQRDIAAIEERLTGESSSKDARIAGLEAELAASSVEAVATAARSSEELTAARARVEKLENRLAQSTASAEADRDRAVVELTTQSERIADLEAQVAKVEAEREALRATTRASDESNEKRIGELERELSEARADAKAIETRLKGEVASTEGKLTEQARTKDARIADLEAELAQETSSAATARERASAELAEHDARIAKLQARVAEVEAERDSIRATARTSDTTNAERIETLERELAEARAQLVATEARLQREVAAIEERLTQETHSRDAKIAGLEAELAASSAEAVAMAARSSEELTVARGRVDALETELAETKASAEADRERNDAELSMHNSRIAELEEQVTEVVAQREAALSSNETNEARVATLEQRLADVTKANEVCVAELEAELAARDARARDLEERLEEAESDREILRETARAVNVANEKRVGRLEADLTEARERLDRVPDEQLQMLADARKGFEAELESAIAEERVALDEAHSALDALRSKLEQAVPKAQLERAKSEIAGLNERLRASEISRLEVETRAEREMMDFADHTLERSRVLESRLSEAKLEIEQLKARNRHLETMAIDEVESLRRDVANSNSEIEARAGRLLDLMRARDDGSEAADVPESADEEVAELVADPRSEADRDD